MTYDLLTMAGIDMDDFLKRLMGNEKLVPLFIKKFSEDNNYKNLIEAFAEKDMQKAEMASHSLKGMCGNLSLTTLFPLFTRQVRAIRSGKFGEAEQLMEQIKEEYPKAISYMHQWLEQL